MTSARKQFPTALHHTATRRLVACLPSIRSFAAAAVTNSFVRPNGVPRHGWVFCVVLALLTLFGGTFGLWDMYRRTVDDLRSEARDSRRNGIKVLLTSGFSGMYDADQRIALCPFRRLSKPYSHAELARMLREAPDGANEPGPTATVTPSDRAIESINDGDLAATMERV
jgi:hypothetical protein